MLTAVAVLASLVFIGWLIFRAVKQKPVKAYIISRALAYVAGVYTFAFFLSMNIPELVKIVVSILLGMALVVLAAFLQRRRHRMWSNSKDRSTKQELSLISPSPFLPPTPHLVHPVRQLASSCICV